MRRCLTDDEWQRYLDDDGDGELRARAEAHAVECATCTARREALDRTGAVVSGLLLLLDDESVTVGVQAARTRLQSRIARGAASRAQRMSVSGLAAACIALVIAGWQMQRHFRAANTSAAGVGSGAAMSQRSRSIPSTQFSSMGGDDPLGMGVVVQVSMDSAPASGGLIQARFADAEVLVGADGLAHGFRIVR